MDPLLDQLKDYQILWMTFLCGINDSGIILKIFLIIFAQRKELLLEGHLRVVGGMNVTSSSL
jgi:hypothetical protein